MFGPYVEYFLPTYNYSMWFKYLYAIKDSDSATLMKEVLLTRNYRKLFNFSLEYSEDIRPYATFHVPGPPSSETTKLQTFVYRDNDASPTRKVLTLCNPVIIIYM